MASTRRDRQPSLLGPETARPACMQSAPNAASRWVEDSAKSRLCSKLFPCWECRSLEGERKAQQRRRLERGRSLGVGSILDAYRLSTWLSLVFIGLHIGGEKLGSALKVKRRARGVRFVGFDRVLHIVSEPRRSTATEVVSEVGILRALGLAILMECLYRRLHGLACDCLGDPLASKSSTCEQAANATPAGLN